MIRDEFVFNIGNKKLYRIEDLDYFDDIVREDHQRFWDNVKKGYIIVFLQKSIKYEKEPKQVFIGKMQIEDAKKKFG
jgi:hypothetical protein